MRAANIQRVKRRMVREAVSENLDVIRGIPPRALRRGSRLLQFWLRHSPFILVSLMLAGSSYVIARAGGDTPLLPRPPFLTGSVTSGMSAALTVPRALGTEAGAERVTAAAFPLSIRRVVLDAGHGGSDPGATAAELLEKEITLDIGLRLQDLLSAHGFEVVLTRERDDTIALKERARVANESRSDIFLSIHVNTIAKHTESRGIETYYLGTTSDPSLSALAASENRVSGYSMADMRKLLDGVYADARRDESRQLANAIQGMLFSTLQQEDPGLENWGVKRAPFIVLVATEMPAVLAEVGCISNEKEAAMLKTPEHRQMIARALFDGIRVYAGATDPPAKKGSEQNG